MKITRLGKAKVICSHIWPMLQVFEE